MSRKLQNRIILITFIFLFLIIIITSSINIYLSYSFYKSQDIMYSIRTTDDYSTISMLDQNNIIYPAQIAKTNIVHNVYYYSLISIILIVFVISVLYFNLGKYLSNIFNMNSDKFNIFDDAKNSIELKDIKIDQKIKELNRLNAYLNHEIRNTLAKDNYSKEELLTLVDTISSMTLSQLNDIEVVDLLLNISECISRYENIKINFDENGFYHTSGNEMLITQVFINIIDNAYKYGASNLFVDIYNMNQNIIIKFSNNGEIIDINKIDKIFDYRFQINEQKAGSGIGLSLVKHILDLHNASIFVESNSKSTIFTLSFPLTNN